MNFWSLLEATSGASQPAFKTYRHGAAQPVGEGALPSQHVAECAGIRVVSFNFGMPQSMLESAKRWNRTHIFKFRDVLMSLGHAAGNDFVFCSEVGDARKGFQATNLDFQNIVAEALPGAACSSSGAYLHVWNVRQQAAAVVASGTRTATTGHTTDVHWQAFELTYRDAPQLADRDALQLAAPKVGVLVGNMHIPVSSSKAPSQATRRRIVGNALQHLTGLEVDGWRDRQNFPVMRHLVGDCNLDKHAAEAVTQQDHSPPLTALQRDYKLSRWQVCDVQFPRQALESARRQNTRKYQKLPWRKYQEIQKSTKQYQKRVLCRFVILGMFGILAKVIFVFFVFCFRADPKACLRTGHHNGMSSPRTRR